MKKLISTLIASAISFSCINAFAGPYTTLPIKLNDMKPVAINAPEPSTDDSLVSILLSADSPTMILNGEEVEITAPYVTDEGVTLVPLRVISEAFGAEVLWDEATNSINIAYSEVNIKLTVGSKAAVVNEHTEELESAPELTNDTTMVPLRFIAETFGAEVSYDSESGMISVSLYDSEEAEMIRGMHDKEYIGDSYLEWSIKTPRNMDLSYRSFNNSSLSFYDEYDNTLYISVNEIDEHEDYDLNTLFQTLLSEANYETITHAEKGTDSNGNPMVALGTKSSYSKTYNKIILKNNNLYTVTVSSYSFEGDKDIDAAYDDLLALTDTFSVSVRDDMYDFSNIKEGVREYKNEELKVSFSTPKNYSEDYSYKFNEISLSSDDENSTAGMAVRVFSKTDTANADTFAQTQYEIDRSVFNPIMVTLSEFGTASINGTDAISYSVEGKTDDFSFIVKKLYFELGEYVYCVSIMNSDESVCEEVINSFKAEELDAEETGTILCHRDLMDSYTYTLNEYKMTLPKYWSGSYSAISDERTGTIILDPTVLTQEDIESLIKEANDLEENVIVKPLKWVETPYGKYPHLVVKTIEKDDIDYYTVIDGKIVGDDIVVFIYTYSELYSGGVIETEIQNIINSTEKLKK